jgi:chemosensory pili system protein ChpA (sensor histidine kinase/response regulator)
MDAEHRQRILGYFIEEAKEHLGTIEAGLADFQATQQDPEVMGELFRAAHSIKGGAAMLDLGSIQRIAHRLEDSFKVLKESTPTTDPQVPALLQGGFQGLQQLLEDVPVGLTPATEQAVWQRIEPIFQDLATLLATVPALPAPGNALVHSQSPELDAPDPNAPELDTLSLTSESDLGQIQDLALQDGAGQDGAGRNSTAQGSPRSANNGGVDQGLNGPEAVQEASALQLIFRSDISTQLRKMLQLFKRSDQIQSQQQLQEICIELQQVGEQFDLWAWTQLVAMAQAAIAHGQNSYQTLAPIIIKDLKQAQDLVLSGQHHMIEPSQELRNLLPSTFSTTPSPDSALDDLLGSIDEAPLDEDLDLSFLNTMENTAPPETPQDSEASAISLEFDQLLDELNQPEPSSIPNLDLDDNDTHPRSMGPEVGVEELNSLADLFGTDESELGLMWDEDGGDDNGVGEIALTPSNTEEEDISEFLIDASGTNLVSADQAQAVEDLLGLFDEDPADSVDSTDLALSSASSEESVLPDILLDAPP